MSSRFRHNQHMFILSSALAWNIDPKSHESNLIMFLFHILTLIRYHILLALHTFVWTVQLILPLQMFQICAPPTIDTCFEVEHMLSFISTFHIMWSLLLFFISFLFLQSRPFPHPVSFTVEFFSQSFNFADFSFMLSFSGL